MKGILPSLPGLLLGVLLCSTACGKGIPATVAVHHRLPGGTASATYAFAPLKQQDVNNENLVYKDHIRQALLTHRYVETDPDRAAYILSFSYGIDAGRLMETSTSFSRTTYTEYRRGLWVYLFEKESIRSDTPNMLYEGTVTSTGTLAEVANIMPRMIGELFREFPGTPGLRRTELKGE